jgi:hypothetical protein
MIKRAKGGGSDGLDVLRQARWIWPTRAHELHNTYADFRHDFELAAVPRRAPLYISADQCYMLYVNGEFVSRGPARGYQQSWPYDEVDLAGVLRKGHNWISIRAYNAGVGTYGYVHMRAAGMICAAKWGEMRILTGPGWIMRANPAYSKYAARLSCQLAFQEHFDAAGDDQSWIHSAKAPRDWPQVGGGNVFGTMPWHAMEPRAIPNLAGKILPYQRTCCAAAGPCGEGYRSWENPAFEFYHELTGGQSKIAWGPAPAGRCSTDGLTLTVPATGKDRFLAIVCDLGQLAVGTLMVEASGSSGGELVDFYFTEICGENGPKVFKPGEQSCSAMALRMKMAPGTTRYEAFQMIGHRYVAVIARDTGRPIELTLSLRSMGYPLAVEGSLHTSDRAINDIYDICVHTQRICMLDSYVDTPSREQAQWWGDARVQAQNTFHLANDARLLARGIRSIARQEVPNGLTFGHAPSCRYAILPDFSIIWAMTIWDYYWQTGDLTLFEEQWPRIERLLGYFTGEGKGENGLLRYDDRYWLFLDWADIYKEGTPTLLNLWYLLMLEKLATLAGLAGKTSQRRQFVQMHARQAKLILAKLWDPRERLFRDGLDNAGKGVDVYSVHNQTLAIQAGLWGKFHAGMIAKRLRPYLAGESVPGALPSSYWVTYVYSIMRSAGLGELVVSHIRKHWSPMVPYGGTWETFNLHAGSTSHAWAAHPIYHLTGEMGGIVQTGPAWRRISFAPRLGCDGVTEAAATVPTPAGLIKSSWRKTGETFAVNLSLPPGVKADISLTGAAPRAVTGTNRWTVAAGT